MSHDGDKKVTKSVKYYLNGFSISDQDVDCSDIDVNNTADVSLNNVANLTSGGKLIVCL